MTKKREHRGRTIRKEIELVATPEQVWNAWAKADRIAQWFVDRCEGDMAPGATVKWCFDAFGMELPIEVFDARPGEYLAFGGEVEGRPAALQEIVVEQRSGYTLLRLANSGFGDGAEWDDEYEGVDSGWVLALANLKHWLENHATETRVSHFTMRPAEFEYAAIQPLFDTADGLRSWLVESAEVEGSRAERGSRVALTFGDGSTARGEVLARTRRELMLSWPERNGTLALKCFRCGPAARAISMLFNGWGIDERELHGVAELLDAATERLAARVAALSAG